VGVILWELRAKAPPEAAAQDTIGLVSAAFVRGGRGDEITPRTTHVVTVVTAFSDAGSIPAASTNPCSHRMRTSGRLWAARSALAAASTNPCSHRMRTSGRLWAASSTLAAASTNPCFRRTKTHASALSSAAFQKYVIEQGGDVMAARW